MSLIPLLLAVAVGAAPASDAAPVQAPGGASDKDLEALYDAGTTFGRFLETAEARRELWHGNYERADLPTDVRRRAERLRGPWRLLVVAEDWCGDSAHTIPYVARLVDGFDALSMRVVDSEAGGGVMAARPTFDGRPATPTVVVLDAGGREVGCWIERPGPQRARYLDGRKAFRAAAGHDEGEASEEELEAGRRLIREFLDWYEADAGATTVREVVALLEAAERGATGCTAGG